MIKRILSVFLIAMLLVAPAAQAEQAVYTPGSASLALFSEAFTRGDMILMDMNFQLAMNENSEALLGEDAQLLSLISQLLPQTTLTVGFDAIEDGLRVLLAGQYAAGEQKVALDAVADLTKDGLSITSSAIPGERVSAKWETVLTLCGLSEEETAQILSMRDVDLETAIAELAAQLEPIMEMAAQIAAPYGETLLNYFTGLPTEVQTNVAAEGVYPAAATEVCFLITQKSIGDLVTTLAGQLEADATLCALLDLALAQSGEEITTAQLCQAVKSTFESWTDEATPLRVYIGMDETDNFLYCLVTSMVEGAPVFSLICAPQEGTDLVLLAVDYLVLTSEGAPSDGFSFAALYPQTPAEYSLLDVQLFLDIYADETLLVSAEAAIAEDGTPTEAGLPAHAGNVALEMALDDGGDIINLSFTAESAQQITADGGEKTAMTGALEASAYETTIPLAYEIHTLTVPGENGPTASIVSTLTAPALGLDKYEENYTLYTAAYELDYASLTETALETASEADLDALINRAITSLTQTLTELMPLLPPELLEQAM
ncbi:MAG: hypothetical protein IKU38_00605 [Clostridia bacterium]|nr:hypothetical protein [Clostridia bacterium]